MSGTDKAKPGTVRVRILVAVDADGQWVSRGNVWDSDEVHKDWISTDDLKDDFSCHWIEADVPVPAETTIEGSVTNG